MTSLSGGPSDNGRALGGLDSGGSKSFVDGRPLSGAMLSTRGFDSAHIQVLQESHPFGDRMTPVRLFEKFLGPLPRNAIRLDAPYGENGAWLGQKVVVNCPITGMPFTREMARTVGTNAVSLQQMVNKDAPLGLTPEIWQQVQRDLFTGLEKAGLLTARTLVKVGGSSVGGFSSAGTALDKPLKGVAQTNVELIEKIHRVFTDRDPEVTYGALEVATKRAIRITQEAFAGLPIWPESPPWGLQYKLRVEPGLPDVDLQIYAPDLIEEVMAHAKYGPMIHELEDKRLKTLDNDTVIELHPEFEWAIDELRKVRVEVEFITMREQMHRKDWWPVTKPC